MSLTELSWAARGPGPGDRVGKPERGQPVSECVCVCGRKPERDHPLPHTDIPGEYSLPGRRWEL